MPGDKGNPV